MDHRCFLVRAHGTGANDAERASRTASLMIGAARDVRAERPTGTPTRCPGLAQHREGASARRPPGQTGRGRWPDGVGRRAPVPAGSSRPSRSRPPLAFVVALRLEADVDGGRGAGACACSDGSSRGADRSSLWCAAQVLSDVAASGPVRVSPMTTCRGRGFGRPCADSRSRGSSPTPFGPVPARSTSRARTVAVLVHPAPRVPQLRWNFFQRGGRGRGCRRHGRRSRPSDRARTAGCGRRRRA